MEHWMDERIEAVYRIRNALDELRIVLKEAEDVGLHVDLDIEDGSFDVRIIGEKLESEWQPNPKPTNA